MIVKSVLETSSPPLYTGPVLGSGVGARRESLGDMVPDHPEGACSLAGRPDVHTAVMNTGK